MYDAEDTVRFGPCDIVWNMLTFAGQAMFQQYSTIYLVFQIRTIPQDHFATLHLLEDLIMANNKLEKISNYTFTELSHLLILDACHNEITILEAHCFYALISLKYLRLHHNKIMAINLEGLMPGLTVYLADNQIEEVNGLMGLARRGHDEYYYWTNKRNDLIGKLYSKLSPMLPMSLAINITEKLGFAFSPKLCIFSYLSNQFQTKKIGPSVSNRKLFPISCH